MNDVSDMASVTAIIVREGRVLAKRPRLDDGNERARPSDGDITSRRPLSSGEASSFPVPRVYDGRPRYAPRPRTKLRNVASLRGVFDEL